MKTACVLIKPDPHYRSDAFKNGLKRLGYKMLDPLGADSCDLLVTWNRIGYGETVAARAQRRGAVVVVAENAYFGNDFLSKRWYSLSLNHHLGPGSWLVGGNERWDSLSVDLSPWKDGSSYLVLPQRGIGGPATRMPSDWLRFAEKSLSRVKIPYKVRCHPGKYEKTPLSKDLVDKAAVVTWASGAAVKALMEGVPVFYELKNWVMASCSTHISNLHQGPLRSDALRLDSFRRMAWCQWTVEEIASGLPFERLLTKFASE